MRALLTVICLLFLFAINTYAIKNSGDNSIKSPLNPPYYFAGNFGELRPNHFHAGLDFRTQGKIGLPVYAVKDGYISKIGVSPTGYGNVLYMNHSDGTTTLYGHLLKFQTSIQDYVREKQYDKESFALTLNPSENQFRFKQGDIIAWSGNTGSSGGPHLHFEIRNSKSEIAENPLFYPMGITDKSAPKESSIWLISARWVPSTRTFTVPSGSFSICKILAIHPTAYKSRAVGSSFEAVFWATRRILFPVSIAASRALIDFGRPTNKGITICGNTTTSRSGSSGN